MRGYFYSPAKSWLGRICNRIKGHLGTGPGGVQRNVFTEMREEREQIKARGDAKRMREYEGSPSYQAMLKRNGGKAPGTRRP